VTEPSVPKPLTARDLDRLKTIALGSYAPPPKAKFRLETDALFGGVFGLKLPCAEFWIMPGLSFASTYAHVMQQFIMAFGPPERPTAPHPGPWASLHGRGFDITAEVRLEAGCAPLGFDRLNTLWFVVALLRLRLAQPIQMPVLADRPLNTVSATVELSNLLPVELDGTRMLTESVGQVDEDDLSWLSHHIAAAAGLIAQPIFNRAFQTLDQAVAINNPGAGMVIAWAAIETLLRPGSQRITERLSRGLAAYLHPPGSGRDRAFGEIVKSYEARGGAAHAGAQPEAEQFQTSFRLARLAIVTAIEGAGYLTSRS
jgi:hypothetical protein